MFSTIFNSAKAFLKNTRIGQDSSNHIQPAEQLQSELWNAIDEEMVTTRRQSHILPHEELRDGSEINNPTMTSKKRKNAESKAITPLAVPTKRRKTSLDHLDNDGQTTTGKSVPAASEQQNPTVQVDQAVNQGHEGYKRKKESGELNARQSRSKQGRVEAARGDDDHTPDIKLSKQLASFKDDKAATNRTQHKQPHQLEDEASDLTVGEKTGTASIPTAPKATHFRFSSEEFVAKTTKSDIGHSHPNALVARVVGESEESDAEDEAPETITASVGAATARARNIEADKAAERQRVTAKEKRRERNDILRQQAQSSKKAKKRKAVETLDAVSEPDDSADSAIPHLDSAPSHARTMARRPLPALLPDDILAADPGVRPATPPLDQERGVVPKPKKHVFVETDPKPPKDIKRGPVKVRVLEGTRQNLPPKTSKESRNIKESWLGGRRGRNGATVMERRKVGFGFARK